MTYVYKEILPTINELLNISDLKKIIFLGPINNENAINQSSIRSIQKRKNKAIYPELNALLKKLCELANLKKLYIIGYASSELFLTNLPSNLSVLKLSNYDNLELINLPLCLQKIIIENNKNNIFAKKGEYDEFIKPISQDKIIVKLNNFTYCKLFYKNNMVDNNNKKVLFNIKIEKIPYNCNVIFAKSFELTFKYTELKNTFLFNH